jgi:hypothetical protein
MKRIRTGNWDGAKETSNKTPAFMVTLGPKVSDYNNDNNDGDDCDDNN